MKGHVDTIRQVACTAEIMDRAPTWLVVYLPLALLAIPPLVGYHKDGCVPIHNSHGHWPCVGPPEKLETISEMVARSGITAEMFCATAALTLVGMHIALKDIMRLHPIQGAAKDAVQAAFYIGSLGYVGLTVWSIRVSGHIHTGFTAQTLCMMTLTCVILCIQISDFQAHLYCGFLVLSIVAYAGLFAAKEDFSYDGASGDYSHYFDFKYNLHAPAQYCCVAFYHLTIGRLHGLPSAHGEWRH
jgi:hypothetical protein